MIERVILAAIFYIFVTPIALILKFCKVDLLRLKIDDNQESYWIKSKGTEIRKRIEEKTTFCGFYVVLRTGTVCNS